MVQSKATSIIFLALASWCIIQWVISVVITNPFFHMNDQPNLQWQKHVFPILNLNVYEKLIEKIKLLCCMPCIIARLLVPQLFRIFLRLPWQKSKAALCPGHWCFRQKWLQYILILSFKIDSAQKWTDSQLLVWQYCLKQVGFLWTNYFASPMCNKFSFRKRPSLIGY